MTTLAQEPPDPDTLTPETLSEDDNDETDAVVPADHEEAHDG